MKLLNVFFLVEVFVDDWEEIVEKFFENGIVLVELVIVRGMMFCDDF